MTNKNVLKKQTNGFNLKLSDPIEAAISKYKNNLSLNVIQRNLSKFDNLNFHLEYKSQDQILKKLEKLDPRKASQVKDIHVKVIKENKDIAAFSIHTSSLQ